MEKPEMRKRGVGPKIFKPTFIYGVTVLIITLIFPEIFLMTFLPSAVFNITGGILLGLGMAFLFISGVAMKKAVTEGRLETSGTFSIVRNPLYFAWIAFVFPGSAVASQGWLLFGMSMVAYYKFLQHIPEEEATLEKHFGKKYLEYKKSVPAIVPNLRGIL
ncbi:methyltransferase family protein [Maridesulfovibrio hydrothermalis]|uniref:Isoprenylcysteine carboxyl methyltransferase n=1 Tax=Maridesulfovibrio hydrothermalis AM13 = DSM 14728 TaxID=1121451 RepID=L0R989_9BACT|nr:isoprenylcysteine carboxylmethyltransferase family protein [Maridesulfovibrio hydrothermalis]CCO23323.1 Isoprenylcysteine carboxyl methyltransferase [Maridesulfovibrio hydrothermalis AM13 = DSM 14728]